MVAACTDPVAVGVTEDGDGAGAQAATSMSRHRLNQRICRQATKQTCIGVLLSCVLGRGSSPRALPVRCRVIGHPSFLDACCRFAHNAFRRLALPLVGTKTCSGTMEVVSGRHPSGLAVRFWWITPLMWLLDTFPFVELGPQCCDQMGFQFNHHTLAGVVDDLCEKGVCVHLLSSDQVSLWRPGHNPELPILRDE